MLKLSSTLLNVPVVSLQLGRPIAVALQPLINPNNLKIEGWFCQIPVSKETLFLPLADIREMGSYGIAVNTAEALAPLEDFVRLAKIITINYQLIGKKVETITGKKVGKVEDYAVNIESMYVQKLYVNQRSINAFLKDQLSISRLQIREISRKKIVIEQLEGFEKGFFKRPIRLPESA